MEPFPFDHAQGMVYAPSPQSLYSSSADSNLESYAASPYDEWAMMPLDFQGYFPPQAPAPQAPASQGFQFQQSLVGVPPAPPSIGVGTRPIAIPHPPAQNGSGFGVAPSSNSYSSFAPSPYSSSPGLPSPYLGSPAVSQSSMTLGSTQRPQIHVPGALQMQSAPVTSYASSPAYPVAHAIPTATPSLTSAPLLVDRQRRVAQRGHSERQTRSFDCKKCGRSFTRLADVKRHETSVHDPVPIDCPIEDCSRKGNIGFPRRDHLIEHLRTFHNRNIPKRTVAKKRKGNGPIPATL